MSVIDRTTSDDIAARAVAEAEAQYSITCVLAELRSNEQRKRVLRAAALLVEADEFVPGVLAAFADGVRSSANGNEETHRLPKS